MCNFHACALQHALIPRNQVVTSEPLSRRCQYIRHVSTAIRVAMQETNTQDEFLPELTIFYKFYDIIFTRYSVNAYLITTTDNFLSERPNPDIWHLCIYACQYHVVTKQENQGLLVCSISKERLFRHGQLHFLRDGHGGANIVG